MFSLCILLSIYDLYALYECLLFVTEACEKNHFRQLATDILYLYYSISSYLAACLRSKGGRFLTLDHMGTPLKNQNFENGASSCFKLAQIRSSQNFMNLGLLVAEKTWTMFYHIFS